MKKTLLWAMLSFLFFVGGVQAAEIRFAFHLQLPPGLPAKDQFLYRLVPVEQKEIQADVGIPGLPVVFNQRMVYMTYKSAPANWGGQTITWYGGDECSTVNVHVAINTTNGLPTLYNELFQLGFVRAIARLGINICDAQKKGDFLYFLYAGRRWSDNQLEEAASEIGVIRAADKLGRPEIVRNRFDNVMRIERFEPYALIQFLIKRAQGDPQKYEAELKKVVESFLDRHQPKK